MQFGQRTAKLGSSIADLVFMLGPYYTGAKLQPGAALGAGLEAPRLGPGRGLFRGAGRSHCEA